MMRAIAVVCCFAAGTLMFGQCALGAEPENQRGEALVTRHCGSCHAIGRSGDSPLVKAPALRTLGSRYPIEDLEEALSEGIITGHPDMPELEFEAEDIEAIVAYLKVIQNRAQDR